MSSYKKLSAIGNLEPYETDKTTSLKPAPIQEVPEIKTLDEKNLIISQNKVCVIDIYANWCGPCKIVSPLFTNLFPKYNNPGVCALLKENVELRLSPDVQVIPTFQFYLNGTPHSIITGADITSIEERINELIST